MGVFIFEQFRNNFEFIGIEEFRHDLVCSFDIFKIIINNLVKNPIFFLKG